MPDSSAPESKDAIEAFVHQIEPNLTIAQQVLSDGFNRLHPKLREILDQVAAERS
jgi:hypothetical protein